MSQQLKPNILVIGNLHTHPSAKSFLDKFVNIVKEIANEVYVISGDNPPIYKNVLWIKLTSRPKGNLINKSINFIYIQLKLTKIITTSNLNYKIVLILPTSFILPNLILKLIGKKVAVFVAQKPKNFLFEVLARLNFIFSDILIVESRNVIKDWKIKGHKKKIRDGSVYVDTSLFKKYMAIQERKEIVGYIGSLEKRKGVIELVKAISIVNKKKHGIKFVLGGVGHLEDMIKILSSKNNNVEFKGFIPQDDLPKYFNLMRLFVLPSYSEGMPNIVLESMACGTPVLATPVGGISDIINDEETGFIMESNSPECIAENILRALNNPKLEKISENGINLIEREFLYKYAIKRYKKILINMCY